ncbi:MAG: PQQ-binding-like beta-propeller repeat protein, partial [Rubripirellula sp.]
MTSEAELTPSKISWRTWVTSVCFALAFASMASAEDWRLWRGPTLDNHAPASAADAVPLSWSKSENVAWMSPIPGKGHATPIVVDNGIFVLTHEASDRTISLLRFNLADGKPSGKVVLHRNVTPPNYLHKKNTCASGTPSSDGSAIYVAVQYNETIAASAISTKGKLLWQQKVAPYRAGRGWFGYGSSPLLLDRSVIVPVDTDNSDGGLFALDKKNGRVRWRSKRPLTTSYSSPILAEIQGRPQILLSGGNQTAAYDPDNGKQLWRVNATSRTTCATMVWNDEMAFASGSYPDPGTFGIKVGPQGASIAWENRVKCYEQSMLLVGDYLYGIADSGVAYCWRASDGTEMWKNRLKGPFSASPLLIGDRIYASNERGTTYVFRASSAGYEKLSENVMDDTSFASPIYAHGRMILRHALDKGRNRQEYLVSI